MSESSEFEISLLQKNEIDAFKKVYLSALKNNWKTLEGHNNRERWQRNFNQWIRNNYTIFLSKLDGNIVGYITGDPSRIMHIWVHEKQRRKSCGQQLINKFLQYQHKKGFDSFTLKAYKSNIPFFKNAGFDIKTDCAEFAILKINTSDWE